VRPCCQFKALFSVLCMQGHPVCVRFLASAFQKAIVKSGLCLDLSVFGDKFFGFLCRCVSSTPVVETEQHFLVAKCQQLRKAFKEAAHGAPFLFQVP